MEARELRTSTLCRLPRAWTSFHDACQDAKRNSLALLLSPFFSTVLVLIASSDGKTSPIAEGRAPHVLETIRRPLLGSRHPSIRARSPGCGRHMLPYGKKDRPIYSGGLTGGGPRKSAA